MNDVLKQYFQEIRKLLLCDEKQKNRCIAELDADISSFLESKPNATLDDLYAAFGTPQSIAESFLERVDPEQLSHKVSAKRKIAFGVIATVILLAIALGITACLYAEDLHDFFSGYYVDDIEYFETVPSNAEPTPSPIIEY